MPFSSPCWGTGPKPANSPRPVQSRKADNRRQAIRNRQPETQQRHPQWKRRCWSHLNAQALRTILPAFQTPGSPPRLLPSQATPPAGSEQACPPHRRARRFPPVCRQVLRPRKNRSPFRINLWRRGRCCRPMSRRAKLLPGPVHPRQLLCRHPCPVPRARPCRCPAACDHRHFRPAGRQKLQARLETRPPKNLMPPRGSCAARLLPSPVRHDRPPTGSRLPARE